MQINDKMKHYIDKAVDAWLQEVYPKSKLTRDRVKNASRARVYKNADVLLRALELACADLETQELHTITLSAVDFKTEKARLEKWNVEQKAKRAKEREDDV